MKARCSVSQNQATAHKRGLNPQMSKSPNTPIFDHQDLFRRMPVPRMIVQPEENGAYRVIECNDAAMAYFDKSEEQIVGHHIKEFMSGENIIHFVCF